MRKSIFISLAVVLIAAGCRKGDTGPQGPAGNANVQSYLYATTSDSWSTSDTGLIWATGFVVPEIDQSVINSGAVLIYYVDSSSSTNYSVPFFENSYSEDVTASIAPFDGNANDPNVIVSIESTNGVAFLNPGSTEFRVVVIPSENKKGFVAPTGLAHMQTTVKR